MRLLSLSAAAAAGVLATGSIASAATYPGNAAMGFGGGIGNSTLTVTDGGSTVNFSLSTSGFGGNGLAIYLDTVSGGANSSAAYTDNADGGRTVVSGNGGASGKSLVTFASGFGADYAVSVEPDNGGNGPAGNGFAGIFNLATPTNFSYVGPGGLSPNASTTLTFTVNKADVGLPATGSYSFTFEGSLISTSGYRSNETIGTSSTTPDPANNNQAAPNAGFNGSTTFSTANTFSFVAAPEPSSVALLGLTALGGLRRRRA